MPKRVELLLKVFRVELEETENDIISLLDYHAKRFDKDEITPYVWMENRALLIKEISCVKELEGDVAAWQPDEGKCAAEVLSDLRDFLINLVKERGYPELVTLVIDKIANKITRYLE